MLDQELVQLVPSKKIVGTKPTECTNPSRLWCPDRVWSLRYQLLACRGTPCKSEENEPQKETVSKPQREWLEADANRLRLNSHLSLKALCWLMDDYTEDEIRAKLEEIEE